MSAVLRSAVIDIGIFLDLVGVKPVENSGRTGMPSRSVATLDPRAPNSRGSRAYTGFAPGRQTFLSRRYSRPSRRYSRESLSDLGFPRGRARHATRPRRRRRQVRSLGDCNIFGRIAASRRATALQNRSGPALRLLAPLKILLRVRHLRIGKVHVVHHRDRPKPGLAGDQHVDEPSPARPFRAERISGSLHRPMQVGGRDVRADEARPRFVDRQAALFEYGLEDRPMKSLDRASPPRMHSENVGEIGVFGEVPGEGGGVVAVPGVGERVRDAPDGVPCVGIHVCPFGQVIWLPYDTAVGADWQATMNKAPPPYTQSLLLYAYQDSARALIATLHERGHARIRPKHGAVFANLDKRGTRASVLAERAGMGRAAMGELIDDLERMGYVRRALDPAD